MSDPRNLLTDDLQASAPEVRIGLSRVGVTGVSKAIRLSHAGTEKLIAAEIDCTVDLDPDQKGVHMSRFPELFGEAIDEVVIGEAFLVEELADHIARHVVERQRSLRAEVRIVARWPVRRHDHRLLADGQRGNRDKDPRARGSNAVRRGIRRRDRDAAECGIGRSLSACDER